MSEFSAGSSKKKSSSKPQSNPREKSRKMPSSSSEFGYGGSSSGSNFAPPSGQILDENSLFNMNPEAPAFVPNYSSGYDAYNSGFVDQNSIPFGLPPPQYFPTPFVPYFPAQPQPFSAANFNGGQYGYQGDQRNGHFSASDDVGAANYQQERNRGLPRNHRNNRPRNSVGTQVNKQQCTRSAKNGGQSASGRNEHQKSRAKVTKESEETLRVRLAEQLEAETYECMVCCDRVLTSQWTWSCTNCYQIFHLRCVKKWASKSLEEDGLWRCPGCQNVNLSLPNDYLCFCGKVPNPKYRRGDNTPHACSEACRKERSGGCTHKCTLPCHPGPCPPCPRTLKIKCSCSREEKTVRCGTVTEYKCSQECLQMLNCEIHQCSTVCHSGSCKPCDKTIKQTCYCGKTEREVPCTVGNREAKGFGCGNACSKEFACGNHSCTKPCHEDECEEKCPYDPEVLKKCPCGKVELSELGVDARKLCTDPVAVCGNKCGKLLKCGSKEKSHYCQADCHTEECPPCPEMTTIRCRCKGSSKLLPCAEVAHYNQSNPLLCERRCKKQRTCRMHKCGNVCCVERDHICMQICGKPLNCDKHTCEQLCHSGKCPPCLQASFTELFCECGQSVIHPPVSCGARPPCCAMPCSREHSCNHPITHNCHSDPQCPQCTHLTSKWCYGHHELRRNIPCFLNDVSCGKPCGRRLDCGQHFCMKTCHPGACLTEDEECKYRCQQPREECGHPCNAVCHGGRECPETVCKFMVRLTCKCGNGKGEMSCVEVERQWSRTISLKGMEGKDIRALQRRESTEKFKSLECTDECARIERNRNLADALNVQTGDFVGDRTPVYTDSLKTFCLEDRATVLRIEKAMVELVQSLDQPKVTVKTHVFQPMNQYHRRAIHEYSSYFQIETMSYDPEPQRNVVATAKKGQSVIPSVLLSTAVQQSAKTAMKVAPPPTINSWSSKQAAGSSIQDVGSSTSQENNLQSLSSSVAVTKR